MNIYIDHFNVQVLQEIHTHMDDMEVQINKFHDVVAESANKWRRSQPFPVIVEGDSIPVSLIIPVCIDSFVDGFLIGITVSISFKAGLILSLANCLEMGFLGMALTTRVMKCTKSSVTARYASIIVPPLIMFFAAGIGGEIGLISHAQPIIFVALVAFGVIAILFLVCNELLIEARELQGEDTKWWISATVFLGIFVVILLDTFLP